MFPLSINSYIMIGLAVLAIGGIGYGKYESYKLDAYKVKSLDKHAADISIPLHRHGFRDMIEADKGPFPNPSQGGSGQLHIKQKIFLEGLRFFAFVGIKGDGPATTYAKGHTRQFVGCGRHFSHNRRRYYGGTITGQPRLNPSGPVADQLDIILVHDNSHDRI